MAKPYVPTYGLATIYAQRKSRDHTATKFAAFVNVVCDAMYTKFCSNRTIFDKVVVKKTKNINRPKFEDPSIAAVSPHFKRSMSWSVSAVTD